MDIEEKALRKRRRSVRNLRRTSIVMPLNLDTLDENVEDDSSKEIQSNGNQAVFGSMWCESLEPVVKKRRRRSSLLVGLVPRLNDPDVEENVENHNLNTQNAYITKTYQDQTLDNIEEPITKTNSLTNSRETLKTEVSSSSYDANYPQVSLSKSSDDYSEPVTRTNSLSENLDTSNENALVKQRSSGSCENSNESEEQELNEKENTLKREDGEKFNDSQILDESFTDINIEIQGDNSAEKISLNASDLSNITPPSECSLSNVSSFSMSPEYTGTYQKYCEGNNTYTENNTDEKTVCNTKMACDAEEDESSSYTRPAYTNVNGKSLNESPGIDRMSDSSQSDKENSVVNENTSMNVTPQGDFTDNVSPGFMSMCKAFAGKVVNFVKTSPSFLTGGFLDSSNTTNVCASPDLNRNTSHNLVCNELRKHAVKSDVNKSLDQLGSEIDKEYQGFKNTETGADCKGDNSAGNTGKETNTTFEQSLSCKKSTIEKPLSARKSVNQCRPGSAKKTRDRKLFFDTYNAVMDVLSSDKRKSSVTVENKHEIGEAGTSYNRIIVGEPAHASVKPSCSSISDMNSPDAPGDELDDTSSRVYNENVEFAVTQQFDITNQESLKEYESTEQKINTADEIKVCNSDASKTVLDNVSKDTGEVCKVFEDKTDLNNAWSRNIPEKKSVRNECQDELKTIPEIEEENSCENVAKNELNTDICVIENTHVIEKEKRRKRRALDIPIIDNSEIIKSAENEKDIMLESGEKMGENHIKINETPKENLVTSPEHLNCFVADKDCLIDTQKHIDAECINMESQVEVGKKTKKSLAKVRKSRRQSFGIQNYGANAEGISTGAQDSTGTDINVARIPSRDADEVDGINEKHDIECHTNIENRVAALDLGNENTVDTNDNNNVCNLENNVLSVDFEPSGKSEIEKKDTDLTGYMEKKKRGRRRKSANLNEILKRGRPKKVLIEAVVDETEESGMSPKDIVETSNVSELTDEISQVQIIDSDKRDIPVESEITVESLVLPEYDINDVKQNVEPTRKRRRSAEAASLKLQMINSDQSPSSSESVTAIKGKRGRRKSADAANLKVHIDMTKETSFTTTENSSPNFEESTVTKRGKKRKYKEDSAEELEKIYKNKNFVKPEEKKPWHTILESPKNLSEGFGKKRLQRHIDFEAPSQMKLRRRLQKAVKNGWDPKKRVRMELEDEFVKVKLVKLWSELDDDNEDDSESLQNKLRSIVETN